MARKVRAYGVALEVLPVTYRRINLQEELRRSLK